MAWKNFQPRGGVMGGHHVAALQGPSPKGGVGTIDHLLLSGLLAGHFLKSSCRHTEDLRRDANGRWREKGPYSYSSSLETTFFLSTLLGHVGVGRFILGRAYGICTLQKYDVHHIGSRQERTAFRVAGIAYSRGIFLPSHQRGSSGSTTNSYLPSRLLSLLSNPRKHVSLAFPGTYFVASPA